MVPGLNNPESLISEELKAVREQYPTLLCIKNSKTFCLQGSFPVIFNQIELDRFAIKVLISNKYPETVPDVYEVGSRIPQVADRHIYGNGQCCLFLPEERWRYFPPGSKLIDFISGPVHNFFLYQSCVEHDITWPHGERSHGSHGVYEFYSEQFITNDLIAICGLVERLAQKSPRVIWSHPLCPCGSGKPTKDCHLSMLVFLRERISPEIAWRSLEWLKLLPVSH